MTSATSSDGDSDAPEARSIAIVSALGAEEVELRMLALGLAAEDPGSVSVAQLAVLLDDDDGGVRARAAQTIAARRGDDAVSCLAERLGREADELVSGTLLRCLASAVAVNRPLSSATESVVRAAIDRLDDARRDRHHIVIETLDRFLGPEVIDVRQATGDTRTDPRVTGDPVDFDDPTSAYAPDTDGELTGIVMGEVIDVLIDGPPEDRAVAFESVASLPADEVEAWLRSRVESSTGGDLPALASAIIDLRGVDLTSLLCDRLLGSADLRTRDQLAEVLRADARSWRVVEDRQTDARLERRLEGLRLAGLLDADHPGPIRRALRDPAAAVRQAAVDAVGSGPDPRVSEVLSDLLVSDVSPAVRSAAGRPLAGAPRPVRVDAAKRALDSDDDDVRVQAVSWLTDGGSEEVVLLARAIRDSSPQVVTEAARLLVESAPREAPRVLWEALVSGGASHRMTLVARLDEVDPGSLDALVHQALDSDDADERSLGLMIAARRDRRESVNRMLHDALTDPAVEVRLNALEALSEHPESVDVDIVGSRVGDPAPAVRLEAVRLLRSIVDDRSLGALVAAAGDPAEHVRKLAHAALMDRRGPALAQQLVTLIADPTRRRAARDLLIDLGHAALEAILDRLEELETRRPLGTSLPGEPDVSSVLSELGGVLRTGDHVELMVRRLGDREEHHRRRALLGLRVVGDSAATLVIAQRLQDPVASIRRLAARTLADLGDRRAIEPLRGALLSDPDLDLVGTLESALRSFDDDDGDDEEEETIAETEEEIGETDDRG